jgi:ribosomal protein S11
MKQKQGKQKFKKSSNTLGAVDGIIYLTLTKNNTILTLTTLQGEVLS